MLEITQEILERIDPLLDAGDTQAAGELLVDVDKVSLRAVLIHVLRKRGGEVADAVGAAYLRKHEACLHRTEAA